MNDRELALHHLEDDHLLDQDDHLLDHDDHLLDHDDNDAEDTIPISHKHSCETQDSKHLEDSWRSEESRDGSADASLSCNISEAPEKRDVVDVDVSDKDVEDLLATESGDDDQDEEQSHSSRFKPERNMTLVNKGKARGKTKISDCNVRLYAFYLIIVLILIT